MKDVKNLRVVFIFFLLFVIQIDDVAAAAKKLRVAILEFDGGTEVKNEEVKGLSRMLNSYFVNSIYFDVIENVAVLDSLSHLKSKNLLEKNSNDIAGVEAVILGTVNFETTDRTIQDMVTGMSRGEYNLDVRLMDLQSGKILAAAGVTWNKNETKRDIMGSVAEILLKNYELYLLSNPSTNAKIINLKPLKILDYLYVYPEELGSYSREPATVLENINKQCKYGYSDWRIPTEEELSLINAKIESSSLRNHNYAYSNCWNAVNRFILLPVRTEIIVQKNMVNASTPFLDDDVYDFGEFSFLDGKVGLEVVVHNPTSREIAIDNIMVLDLSLTVEYDKRPIPSGSSKMFKLYFNTSNRKGTHIDSKMKVTLKSGVILTALIKGVCR